MSKVEKLARYLCQQAHCDPDALEPGDAYGVDGRMRNGDPAHFMWREYVERAEEIIALLVEE